MMKIALVSPYDFATAGGVNNHISLLKDNFKQMGHDVRILAPCSKELKLEELIVLGRHPVPVAASGSWARITLSLTLPKRVKRVVSEEKFDVIHLHEPVTPFLPFYVIRASPDTPKVATFHAAKDGGNRLYWALKPVIKQWVINKQLDECICVSEAARKNVATYFPGNYSIIPNGIDLSHFSRDKEPVSEFLDGKVNILYVGRLDDKRKGFSYLFEAFRRLQKERNDVRLLVVGSGDTPCKRVAEQQGLDIKFMGFVPYEQLPNYYRTAHIYCAPNTGQESQGIVLLEAMGCGAPIVASDIPGFRGVISDGREGLLVPPKDVGALANTLLRLIRNSALRKGMGRRGLETSQQYNGRKVAERVLERYAAAIEKHNAAQAI